MHRAGPRAAMVVLCTSLVVALGTAVQQTDAGQVATSSAFPDPLVLGPGWWSDGEGSVSSMRHLGGVLDVERGTDRLTLTLDNARVTGIPDGCRPSTIVRSRSWISDEGDQLVCLPERSARQITVPVLALGDSGDLVQAHVRTIRRGEIDQFDLPSREMVGGDPSLEPLTRLVSSPDFLNADVADLSRGDADWTGAEGESANGTNPDYERALDSILGTWADLDPAAVLVAGDLVDGRWGLDDQDTGNFGPVDTFADKQQALRRAAATYYPQWTQRFADRGLTTLPAIGDHEYGDLPDTPEQRLLAPDYRKQYGKYILRTASGERRFADHPKGRAAKTAYATRISPDVQLVSIDAFDITDDQASIGLDDQQLEWLEGVLADARADDVRWIVVQGHVPIVYPVPKRGSSGLHYPGGTESDLWKLFRRYDVDLYLNGEVHDASAVTRGGVTQVSHGGMLQFGLTNYLLMDFYDDGIYLTLRDFSMSHADASNGTRLWETARSGMPKRLKVSGDPRTIGTAAIGEDGIGARTGVLAEPE